LASFISNDEIEMQQSPPITSLGIANIEEVIEPVKTEKAVEDEMEVDQLDPTQADHEGIQSLIEGERSNMDIDDPGLSILY
jgi:hypothetical protein